MVADEQLNHGKLTSLDEDNVVEYDAEFWGENLVSLEDEADYVNLLVYGKSGVGKTVFAGSDDKVLFIAPEDKGTLSAKRMGSTARKWPITTWADIEAAYEKLYEAQESGGIPFNWVVIDSLSAMQAMCMRAILQDAVDKNPERDPDIPQIQDWMKYYEMFKRFVLAFNDLDVNVLYTALVRNAEDEEGNDFLTPDIQGKGYQLAQTIASYMTSFGCMQIRRRKVAEEGKKEAIEEYRRITWKDTGVIQGKDRTNVLAPFTNDMTLKQVRQKIQSFGSDNHRKTKKVGA